MEWICLDLVGVHQVENILVLPEQLHVQMVFQIQL